jgi:hypothetical protein
MSFTLEGKKMLCLRGDYQIVMPTEQGLCESCTRVYLADGQYSQPSLFIGFFFLLLFICAYKACVISPPCPHPLIHRF